VDEDLMLSRSELAALDLLIDAMAAEKAAAAIADPAAFIGGITRGIVKVTRHVGKFALRATPHVAAGVIGGQAAQDPRLQELTRSLSDMPEPTLEQLIALRSLQQER
jgi:hypothetical protein